MYPVHGCQGDAVVDDLEEAVPTSINEQLYAQLCIQFMGAPLPSYASIVVDIWYLGWCGGGSSPSQWCGA